MPDEILQEVKVEKNSRTGNITQIVRIGLPTIAIISIVAIAIAIVSGYDLKTLINSISVFQLLFQPEAKNEILIIIAPFDGNEGIHPEARIEKNLKEELAIIPELSGVRIERYPEPIKEENHNITLEQIKRTYKPSLIIWGWYDKLGITPNYEIIQLQKLTYAFYKPSLTERLRLNSDDPDKFTFYITRELPEEITHLTFFTIGQIYIIRGEPDKARTYLEQALARLPDRYKGTWEESWFLSNLAMVRVLGLNDFEYGIDVADSLIEKYPRDINGYSLRATIFELIAVSEYVKKNSMTFPRFSRHKGDRVY